MHIVDPFQTFATYLRATMENPAVYVLNRWLVRVPGANLDELPRLPRGKWILCGYGRMGRRIREALEASGIATVTIDPNVTGAAEDDASIIVDRANQKVLAEAGVAEATGIVAGTDNDAYNLSILLNARAMNPDVFSVVRQNRHLNETLFDVAGADLIMQPSLVSARRILFLLIAPLLKPFFERVRESRFDSGDAFLESLFEELRGAVGSDVRPRIWTVDVSNETTSALADAIREAGPVSLADILKDPSDRGRRLPCVALVAKSGDGVRVMPELSHSLELGEQILFCGRNGVDHLLDATLNNEYTLRYLMTGIDEPRGIFMRWITRRFGGEAGVRPLAQG